jgi:anaerobic ribonucleoside-triphosphate reductase
MEKGEKRVCWDCKKTLKKGEYFMGYTYNGQTYIKCKKCHQKDPVLRNFQETEVYSRIVGYIRPVKGWNPAKQAEMKDRKLYKIKEEEN